MIRLVDLIMKKLKDMGHTSPGLYLDLGHLSTIKVGGQRIPLPDLQDGVNEAIGLGWLEQGKNHGSYVLTDKGAAQL